MTCNSNLQFVTCSLHPPLVNSQSRPLFLTLKYNKYSKLYFLVIVIISPISSHFFCLLFYLKRGYKQSSAAQDFFSVCLENKATNAGNRFSSVRVQSPGVNIFTEFMWENHSIDCSKRCILLLHAFVGFCISLKITLENRYPLNVKNARLQISSVLHKSQVLFKHSLALYSFNSGALNHCKNPTPSQIF